MFKHQCEAHRTRSAVEAQRGFPLRPNHLQRFLHQKLHSNLTKMFRDLHCEDHRTRSAVEVQHGSSPQAFNAKPTGPDQPLRFQCFVSGHITRSASSIRNFTQIGQKCSGIFTAKPTGPDQPLRFSMALPLRPSMRSPPDQISR